MTQKLGKYAIVEKLGEGAMGAVYKAYDEILDRYVAIKTMAEDIKWDPELKLRFYREARSAAGLHHPNIVTIHDLGEDGKITYIVMELLQGQDLKSIIKSQAPMTLETRLSIIAQVADGLQHAHMNGIIHRDIKPGNIHVSPSGNVKIVDFGIARIPSSDLTRSGARLGTPIYMSPEQIRGSDYDERSDQFSTGIVFYELATYHHPFRDKNIAKTLDNILFQTRLPFAEQLPDAPPRLWEIIGTCLAKEPGQRYGSMAQLSGDCRELLVDLNVTSQRMCKQLKGALPRLRQVLDQGRGSSRLRQLQSEIESLGSQGEKPDYCTLRRLMSVMSEEAPPGEQAASPQPAVPPVEIPTMPVPAAADQPPQPAPPRPEEIKGRELLQAGKAKLDAGALEEALEHLRRAMAALGPKEEVVQALVETRRRIEEQRNSQLIQLVESARQSIAAGDFAKALSLLEEAKAVEPEHPEANALHRKATAEIASEQERRQRRQEAEADKASGLRLLEEGKLRECRETLERAARILVGDQEVEDALRKADEAIHAAEVEERVSQELARAGEFLSSEAYDKARRHVRFVLELDPDNSEAKRLTDRLDEAEAEAKQRQELARLLAQCRAALSKKDYEGAALHAAAVLDLEPGNDEALAAQKQIEREREEARRMDQIISLLSQTMDALNREAFDEAAAHAENTLRVDPHNAEAQEMLRQIEKARESKKKLDEINSLLRRAREALDRESFSEARELVNRALGLDPAHGSTRDFLKRLDTAEADKRKRETLTSMLSRGQLVFLRGELDEAEKCADEMLELDPQFAKAADLLARVRAEREKRRHAEISDRISRAREAMAQADFARVRELATELQQLEPASRDAALLFEEAAAAESRLLQQQIQQRLDESRQAFAASEFERAKQIAEEALKLDAGSKAAKSLLKEIRREERKQAKARAKEARRAARPGEAEASPARPEREELEDRTEILEPPRAGRLPAYWIWSAAGLALIIVTVTAYFWLRRAPAPQPAAGTDTQLAEARAELDRKNYDGAMGTLRSIIAAAPDNSAARELLADAERMKAADMLDSLLIEAQALKSQDRLDESLTVLDRILQLDPSNAAATAVRAEIEERLAAPEPSSQDPAAVVRKRVERATALLAGDKLSEAKAEIDRIARMAPATPELATLRAQLQEKSDAFDRKEQEASLAAERRQRLEELARRAGESFRGGRYREAQGILDQWLALAPQDAGAQALRQQMTAASQSLRTYELAMNQKQYDEALRALSQLEKVNPSDPAIAELRKRTDARKASARATLTVLRLREPATLLLDGKPAGENGEISSLSITTGGHTITVRNSQGKQFEKALEFVDGQTAAFVYDASGPLLRDFEEADRERLAARQTREQVHSYDVEHRHTFGSCHGQLHISGIRVYYVGSEKSHSFNLPFQELKVSVRDDRVEIETKDNRRNWNFKLKSAAEAAEIKVLWERLLQLTR